MHLIFMIPHTTLISQPAPGPSLNITNMFVFFFISEHCCCLGNFFFLLLQSICRILQPICIILIKTQINMKYLHASTNTLQRCHDSTHSNVMRITVVFVEIFIPFCGICTATNYNGYRPRGVRQVGH